MDLVLREHWQSRNATGSRISSSAADGHEGVDMQPLASSHEQRFTHQWAGSRRDHALHPRSVATHPRREDRRRGLFSLDESHWPNYATLVWTDAFDMGEPSKLWRPGVFGGTSASGRRASSAWWVTRLIPNTLRWTNSSRTRCTRSSTGSRSSTRAWRRSGRRSCRS
jgi:hypothetical protein